MDEDLFERIKLNNWLNCELANNVKDTIDMAEKKIRNLEEDKAEDIKELVSKIKKAVLDNNEELVDKYDEELTDLLFNI